MQEFQNEQLNFIDLYKSDLINFQQIALGKEEWFTNIPEKIKFDDFFHSKDIFKLLCVKSKKINSAHVYYFKFENNEFFIKKDSRGNSIYLILGYQPKEYGHYVLTYKDSFVTDLTDYLFTLFKQNNEINR